MTSSAEEGADRELIFALRSIRAIAIFACATTLLVTGIVPALHGWIVGISAFIDRADFVAEIASQTLALVLLFSLGALVVQLMRSRASIVLRLTGLLFSTLAGFATLITMLLDRVPMLLHVQMVLCFCATILGLAFGIDVGRRRAIAGAVPITVAVASLLRGGGAYFAERAAAQRRDLESMRQAFELATTLSTVAAVLVIAACGVAIAWLVLAERHRGIAGSVVAVVVSAVLAWCASAPIDADEAAWSVLLRRIAQEMISLPHPTLPAFLVAFVAVLPAMVAIVAVLLGEVQPAIGASVALALVAGVSAEVPVLGLCLASGAIALSIDRQDPERVFAALEAGGPNDVYTARLSRWSRTSVPPVAPIAVVEGPRAQSAQDAFGEKADPIEPDGPPKEPSGAELPKEPAKEGEQEGKSIVPATPLD